MAKKRNKTIIGAFVVGAVVLLIIAIVVFGSGTIFKRTDKYVLFFDGSVKGLAVGAPVIFRGVQIGNVSEVSLIYDPQRKDVLIPVIIDVELSRVKGAPEKLGYADFNALIIQGLRAGLEVQNFITGQLMIGFDFYPDHPIKTYGLIKKYPELPTLPIPTDIFEVMNELPIKEISDNLEEIVAGVNKLVTADGFYGLNSALSEITQSARSIRLLVEYLEQHPEAILKGKSNSKGE